MYFIHRRTNTSFAQTNSSFYSKYSSSSSGCRMQLPFSVLFFFFCFCYTKQMGLSLISPPSVSASSILLCSAVGPPLLSAEKRKQPALRDHSNLFCPEPLAVQRMSRNGWKGRNHWKTWLLQLFKRLNFTCNYKKSKTLKNWDCSLLKQTHCTRIFLIIGNSFPIMQKHIVIHSVITGGYPTYLLSASKASLSWLHCNMQFSFVHFYPSLKLLFSLICSVPL